MIHWWYKWLSVYLGPFKSLLEALGSAGADTGAVELSPEGFADALSVLVGSKDEGPVALGAGEEDAVFADMDHFATLYVMMARAAPNPSPSMNFQKPRDFCFPASRS